MDTFTAALQLTQRQSFEKALNEGKCADVTLQIGEEQRSVNGAVLAFISPVFEGIMFGAMGNTRPDPSVPIQIKNIEPETFDCIVKFAYNNDPEIYLYTLFPLIMACEKYQIDGLLKCCRKCLSANLNSSNFLDYFKEAVSMGSKNRWGFCTNSLRGLANHLTNIS